jgi:hypothetical protein
MQLMWFKSIISIGVQVINNNLLLVHTVLSVEV